MSLRKCWSQDENYKMKFEITNKKLLWDAVRYAKQDLTARDSQEDLSGLGIEMHCTNTIYTGLQKATWWTVSSSQKVTVWNVQHGPYDMLEASAVVWWIKNLIGFYNTVIHNIPQNQSRTRLKF